MNGTLTEPIAPTIPETADTLAAQMERLLDGRRDAVGLRRAVVNASASQAGLALNGLPLPAGYSLRASTYLAESFNVIAVGGDY